ncbi:MAG: enoyl-CoA hydratase/isomerase family protein [Dehalococcoidia bacterium]
MPTGFGWEFKTQYQKCQWENMEYRGRNYRDALYEKVTPQIARITFNRPEKRNAFNDGQFADMLAGLHEANDDPDVRVVILRGAGPCFGAGHELSSPKEEESPPVSPSLNPTLVDYYGFERRRCDKHQDIMNYPKPTIAQVHGFCIGASEIVATACDFIIAAEDAQFGLRGFGRFPFNIVNWPGFWPAESLKIHGGRLLPELSGREAAEGGLITRAVPLEGLEAEVMRWAGVICQMPAEVLTITKEWLNGIADISGMGASWRSHFAEHLMLQYVHFHPDEVSLYKARRDRGLKGFFVERAVSATPEAKAS